METSGSANISTKLDRIATLAKQAPEMAFTTLAHHIDLDWLREAYRRTRKDGATGVDGQTAAEYAKDLESNLRSLLERAKSGTYRAPPVRRIHYKALERFRDRIKDVWRRWLRRRSSSRVRMSFDTMNRLLERFPLPPPRIVRRNWTPRA